MSNNPRLGGVIFTPVVTQLLLAVVITIGLSFLLGKLKVYSVVPARTVVEVCLFCITFGLLVALTPDGWPVLSAPIADGPR